MALCSASLIITEEIWQAALKFPNGFPGDTASPEWIACELDQHAFGDHAAILRDLNRNDDGTIWATWSDPDNPTVRHLIHCPSEGPKKGDACWLANGHRGGHSWERYE